MNRIYTALQLLSGLLLATALHAQTNVYFNQSIDKRYAWLGNDAEVVDFEATMLAHINSATTSIDVATMSFSLTNIADALATKAEAGVNVRIITNAGHRTQAGSLRALRGACQMADNNLPALIHRINFQRDGGAAPPGFLKDDGAVFGPRGGGLSYGWSVNQTSRVVSRNQYPNPLLDDLFSARNTSQYIWEIALPNGFYYVLAIAGDPNFNSQSYLRAEGQNLYVNESDQGLDCGIGENKGIGVEGGMNNNVTPNRPNAQRVQVSDGRLTLSVGQNNPDNTTFSTLCFVEIYRADATEPLGDTSLDDGNDSEVQERQLHHSKYILIDGGTPSAKLWSSSGNLTGGASIFSEDAIVTHEPAICNAFLAQFNQQWGAATGNTPTPASSNFGTYKGSNATDATIGGHAWQVRFSPSIPGASGYDMANVVSDHVAGATRNLVFCLEQFTNSGGIRSFNGPNRTRNTTIPGLLSNASFQVYGLGGGDDFNPPPWSGANVHVAHSPFENDGLPPWTIHNKYMLRDALHDTRSRGAGRVLCGSMNWSQSGMHTNDEQTLLINDPAIANKYLQHAMARLSESGIQPDPRVDLVLVLDRSTSMNLMSADGTTSKMAASRTSAKLFLDALTTGAGHRVSLVKFGRSVEPFAPAIAPQALTTALQTTYKNQIDLIVANAPIGTATCYGLALQEAMDQLAALPSPNRRVIHFFTDGNENFPPMSGTKITGLQALGIEVHSTAFGAATDNLDPLQDLAEATGGSFAQTSLNTLDLNKRFAEVARNAMRLDVALDPRYTFTKGTEVRETVVLERTTGTAQFIASWEQRAGDAVGMKLEAPDGSAVVPGTTGVRESRGSGYMIVHVDVAAWGGAREGTWTVHLASAKPKVKSYLVDLMVHVDSDVDLQVELLPKKDKLMLLARVLHQGQPVLGGSVKATVQLPLLPDSKPRKTQELVLHDDGQHGDGAANDGLFGSTAALDASGHYSYHVVAECKVDGGNVPLLVRREAMLHHHMPGAGSKEPNPEPKYRKPCFLKRWFGR